MKHLTRLKSFFDFFSTPHKNGTFSQQAEKSWIKLSIFRHSVYYFGLLKRLQRKTLDKDQQWIRKIKKDKNEYSHIVGRLVTC